MSSPAQICRLNLNRLKLGHLTCGCGHDIIRRHNFLSGLTKEGMDGRKRNEDPQIFAFSLYNTVGCQLPMKSPLYCIENPL